MCNTPLQSSQPKAPKNSKDLMPSSSNDGAAGATSPAGEGRPAGRTTATKAAKRRQRGGPPSSSPSSHHPPVVTQHNYHDHSNDLAPEDDNFAEMARSGPNVPFPVRLYDMLECVDDLGLAHIVSWQAHGRAFIVHDADKFRELLPRFFKLSKIPSFQRQLNLYGFVRLTRTSDRGAYYNELFLRGKPFLIQRMTRVKVKGTGVRGRSNPDQEPNFWQMKWVGGGGSREAAAEDDASASAPSATASCALLPRPPQNGLSSSSVVSYDDYDSVASGTGRSSRSTEDDDEDSSSACHGDGEEEQDPKAEGDNSEDADMMEVDHPDDGGHHHQPAVPVSVTTSSSPPRPLGSRPLLAPPPKELPGQGKVDCKDLVLHGWGMPFHYLSTQELMHVAATSHCINYREEETEKQDPPTPVKAAAAPEADKLQHQQLFGDPIDLEGALNDLFGSSCDLLSL